MVLHGFNLVESPAPGVPQTPLHQTVTVEAGGLLKNYRQYPVLWVLPALAYVSLIAGILAIRAERAVFAWWSGVITWIAVIGMVGAAMFPFVMPSISNPSHSLTVWNSGASTLTMSWMLGFTVLFMPIIVSYTSWAFYIMRGKVNTQTVESEESY